MYNPGCVSIIMILYCYVKYLTVCYFVLFQKFAIRPLVVRVDYIPRQFDPVALSRGNYAELLNLVLWKVLFGLLYWFNINSIFFFSKMC